MNTVVETMLSRRQVSYSTGIRPPENDTLHYIFNLSIEHTEIQTVTYTPGKRMLVLAVGIPAAADVTLQQPVGVPSGMFVPGARTAVDYR